ncbi:hypothetical protein [Winogradskyella pulchriflava]|uniref:Uncharacterized protein n=1 Tax=Winogradskyella pulchriflava TaxID=1110688 RepID=A0ABV6QC77_9FLAO
MSIKETFLKKYGIWEYILFIFGIALAGRATYSMVVLNFKETSWLEIAFITTTFFLGVLAFSAPKFLVDLAKRKTGESIKDDEK